MKTPITPVYNRYSLLEMVKEADPATPGGTALTAMLLESYAEYPEASVEWAEKLFASGARKDAMRMVAFAITNRQHDKKPYVILSKAAKLCAANALQDHAHTIYKIAMREFPENLSFFTSRAKLHLDQKNPRAAIALLKPLHDRGQGNTITAGVLGNAYTQNGDPDAAIALLKSLNDQGQGDTVILNILGNAYIQNGDPAAAVALLKPLHDRGKGNPITVKTLANAYIHNGNSEVAIALLKSLHDQGQSDTVILNILGNAYIQNGDPGTAIALLKPVHDQEQGNTITAKTLGNAYIHNNDPKAAIALLKPLYDGGQRDDVTVGTLCNAYIRNRDPKAAIALLKPLHDRGLGNAISANILGNAYIHDGNPKAAISLLEPLCDARQKNTFVANILGNAYIHDGNPKAAIALLKPLHDKLQGDKVTTNTLGNAYASDKDRDGFSKIRNGIVPESLRDYLEAKLFYLTLDNKKAINLLSPYMSRNLEEIPLNIVILYMACVGDDSALVSVFCAAAGDDLYASLVKRRDEWRESPQRAELQDDYFSSTAMLFELGGNPASGADRSKAGLGRSLPIAVRTGRQPT